MSDKCQHVADFYRYRDVMKWDNYMRDALGVPRLSLDALVDRYKSIGATCAEFTSINESAKLEK